MRALIQYSVSGSLDQKKNSISQFCKSKKGTQLSRISPVNKRGILKNVLGLKGREGGGGGRKSLIDP